MQGMIFLTKSLYMVQSDCCPCFLGRSGLRRDIVAGDFWLYDEKRCMD